jgi:hypothetical protein
LPWCSADRGGENRGAVCRARRETRKRAGVT